MEVFQIKGDTTKGTLLDPGLDLGPKEKKYAIKDIIRSVSKQICLEFRKIKVCYHH